MLDVNKQWEIEKDYLSEAVCFIQEYIDGKRGLRYGEDYQINEELYRLGVEKVNDLKKIVGSPYFYKITTNEDYYISKGKGLIEKKIISFTAPFARLRYLNVGDTEDINGYKHTINGKLELSITEANLNSISVIDSDGSKLSFDGKTEKHQILEQEEKIKINEESLMVGSSVTSESKIGPNINSENLQETDKVVEVADSEKNIKEIKQDTKPFLGMKNIINTLREEQDAIMRLSVDDITLIKGPAGSGKTNVSFHRILYICNELGFKQEKIAVFCFNVGLKNYLMSLAEDLSLDKISIYSIDKFIKESLKKRDSNFVDNYYENISNILTVDQIISKWKQVISEMAESVENKYRIYFSEFFGDGQLYTTTDFKSFLRELKSQLGIINNSDEDKTTFEYFQNFFKTHTGFKITLEKEEPKIDIGVISKVIYGAKAKSFDKYQQEAILYSIFLIGSYDTLRFEHIIVDEFQDMSPLRLEILNLLSNGSMTLAGDFAQKLYKDGIKSINDVSFSISKEVILSSSHRSTLEIMLFAKKVFGKDIDAQAETVFKRGETVKYYQNSNEPQLIKRIFDLIKLGQKEYTYAVVLPSRDKAKEINKKLIEYGLDSYFALSENWDFSKQIHVTTYHQVKGMEFDVVIALYPEIIESWKDFQVEEILYTAFTRAKNNLFIFSLFEPKFIGQIGDNLIEEIF